MTGRQVAPATTRSWSGLLAGAGLVIAVAGVVTLAFFLSPITGATGPQNDRALVVFLVTAVVVALLWARSRRAARHSARLTEEQSALRRVATLVAQSAPASAVFAAVTEEVGLLSGADLARMERYEGDDTVSGVAAWSKGSGHLTVGTRITVDGLSIARNVRQTGAPVRLETFASATGEIAREARSLGIRSSVGCPIVVAGDLWGVIAASTMSDDPFPPNIESQIGRFTELVATAIANAQAREELREYAEQQAALRRVATLVAGGEPPASVFTAVTAEVAQVLSADVANLGRYDAGGTTTIVGTWSGTGAPIPFPVGTSLQLGGWNTPTMVFETGRPARIDYTEGSGALAAAARERGIHSSVGAPISVEGRLWGVMGVLSMHERRLPADTEARLAGFTELVATALANAQARVELRTLADEQAALRRVATLVARGEPPAAVFAAVAEEVGLLFGADLTHLERYEKDGTVTGVASWTKLSDQLAVGLRFHLDGLSVARDVRRSGSPVRLETFAGATGEMAEEARRLGIRSSVGCPIVVAGDLWGVIAASTMSDDPFPRDTEAQIGRFTELVATAIANAEAHAELTMSRARIVAAADETRRRMERDLHDGAQQRLVSLALQLRSARASVPAEVPELAATLDRLGGELNGALDELREYARGIHPGILAEGGLAPALRTLADRSPVPVELDVATAGRLPERVEVATYYVVSEALTNAAKHANASVVHVAVDLTENVLCVSVRDDGVGGADPRRGSGLVGLKDRVEATGGSLTVLSRTGDGTHLVVELPVDHGEPRIRT
jgi:signal transduction histidine kinase